MCKSSRQMAIVYPGKLPFRIILLFPRSFQLFASYDLIMFTSEKEIGQNYTKNLYILYSDASFSIDFSFSFRV